MATIMKQLQSEQKTTTNWKQIKKFNINSDHQALSSIDEHKVRFYIEL